MCRLFFSLLLCGRKLFFNDDITVLLVTDNDRPVSQSDIEYKPVIRSKGVIIKDQGRAVACHRSFIVELTVNFQIRKVDARPPVQGFEVLDI